MHCMDVYSGSQESILVLLMQTDGSDLTKAPFPSLFPADCCRIAVGMPCGECSKSDKFHRAKGCSLMGWNIDESIEYKKKY